MSIDLKTNGCTIVYSYEKGFKTFEAVPTNWTEKRFIPSVFDSRCCVEESAVPC